MTAPIHAGWLAGDDYEWAARTRATNQPLPNAPEPDSLPDPAPEPAEDYGTAVRRAGVTELPDSFPSRDALLGDLGGGPDLDLLDRFGRTRHIEDDNPPGVPR